MEKNLVSLFFIITGTLSFAVGLIQVKKGHLKKGTKREKWQTIILFLWTASALIVLYSVYFSGSDYIYPRTFENI